MQKFMKTAARLASLLAVAFAFPAAYLVWRNITEGSDPADALLSQQTLDPLLRTLQLAVLVSAADMVLGTALAWLTTRTDLPFRRLWRVVLPIPLVFPTFIGAAAFIRSLNPGGLANDILVNIGVESTPELKGLFGSWLVLTLFTYPYVYLPVAARLSQLSDSLEGDQGLDHQHHLDREVHAVLSPLADRFHDQLTEGKFVEIGCARPAPGNLFDVLPEALWVARWTGLRDGGEVSRGVLSVSDDQAVVIVEKGAPQLVVESADHAEIDEAAFRSRQHEQIAGV